MFIFSLGCSCCLYASFYIIFSKKMEFLTLELPTSKKSGKVNETKEPKKLSKTKEEVNPVKIIVMSINPRSGSTFLSELLSSSPGSSLWYEPLRYLYEEPAPQTFITKTSKRKTSKPEKTISETKAAFNEVTTREKIKLIRSYMNCDFEQAKDVILNDKARNTVFRKSKSAFKNVDKRISPEVLDKGGLKKIQTNCNETSIRVLKSIRLDVNDLQSLLQQVDNFKIIGLVRDPRAVIMSLLGSPEKWSERMADMKTICRKVVAFSRSIERLGDQLMVLKYEDMMENINGAINDLITFTQVPKGVKSNMKAFVKNHKLSQVFANDNPHLPSEIRKTKIREKRSLKSMDDFLRAQTLREEISKANWKFLRTKNLNKKSDGGGWYFYGINRHTAFNYNHWKEEMSPKVLEAIEQDPDCQEAIIMSNYTLLT